jgi:hypothetical protein
MMSSHSDSFAVSGSSPTGPDFLVQNEGSIFLLHPLTESARDWVHKNLSEDRMTFGDAVVVEHRYIAHVVRGARADGLVLR